MFVSNYPVIQLELFAAYGGVEPPIQDYGRHLEYSTYQSVRLSCPLFDQVRVLVLYYEGSSDIPLIYVATLDQFGAVL